MSQKIYTYNQNFLCVQEQKLNKKPNNMDNMDMNYLPWRQPTPLEVKYLAQKLIGIFPEQIKPYDGWAAQFYQKIYYEYIDVNEIRYTKVSSSNDYDAFFTTIFEQVNKVNKKNPLPQLQGVSLKDKEIADKAYSPSTHGAMIFSKDQKYVLLVQDRKYKKWGMPKGKMGYYEFQSQNSQKTAEREIYQQVKLTLSVQNCKYVTVTYSRKPSMIYLLYIDRSKEKINYCRRQLMNARWFHQDCFRKKYEYIKNRKLNRKPNWKCKWKCDCMRGIEFNSVTIAVAQKIYAFSDEQQQLQEKYAIENDCTAEEEKSVLQNPSWAEKSAKVEQHETLKQNQE